VETKLSPTAPELTAEPIALADAVVRVVNESRVACSFSKFVQRGRSRIRVSEGSHYAASLQVYR
jgi:hypothetical protein